MNSILDKGLALLGFEKVREDVRGAEYHRLGPLGLDRRTIHPKGDDLIQIGFHGFTDLYGFRALLANWLLVKKGRKMAVQYNWPNEGTADGN